MHAYERCAAPGKAKSLAADERRHHLAQAQHRNKPCEDEREQRTPEKQLQPRAL